MPDALFPLYALLSPVEWLTLPTCSIAWQRSSAPCARLPISALAIEAGCMLTFFRIALNFLPVQKLTAWMGKPDLGQMSMTPGEGGADSAPD